MAKKGKTSKLTKTVKKLKLDKASNKFNLKFVLSVVAFAIIASFLIVTGRSAPATASFEGEGANRTANATVVTDPAASNSSYVQFGTAPTSDLNKKCSQLTNLKFCDDFDGVSGTYPDSTKWNVYGSGSSWGSHCWKKTPQNISMDGQGSLKMSMFDVGTTQCTNYYGNPSSITSSGMTTSGRFTTTFGKFEIRAKLSCATGVWGSIWSTGDPWPSQGEIDMWETMDGNLQRIKQTVHAGQDSATHWQKGGYKAITERYCDNYHVFGVDWRLGYVQFTVDGVNTTRINKSDTPAGKYWPFDTGKQYLMLTFQYGDAAEGIGLPNAADLPTSMLIDYVRVYN